MSSTRDKILAEIEAYVASSGMSAREFGLRVRGDSGMVYRVRAGRSLSLDAVDRVRDYMKKNPPASKKKATAERRAGA